MYFVFNSLLGIIFCQICPGLTPALDPWVSSVVIKTQANLCKNGPQTVGEETQENKAALTREHPESYLNYGFHQVIHTRITHRLAYTWSVTWRRSATSVVHDATAATGHPVNKDTASPLMTFAPGHRCRSFWTVQRSWAWPAPASRFLPVLAESRSGSSAAAPWDMQT